MYFGESREDTVSSRSGRSGEAEVGRVGEESLLDLQSLIDRLLIDLV